MRRSAMAIKTLDDLFTHMLQDVYYAENQIAKTLPEMMAKAANPMLKEGFRAHIEETRDQIKRLEQVFQALGRTPQGVTCQAVLGLIEEGQELIGQIEDRDILGGFKWSSQHGLDELIGGTGPEPRPVFSSPGSFAACC